MAELSNAQTIGYELKIPRHFDKVSELISVEDAVKNIPTGDDPRAILESIRTYEDAGFDHIYIHNIGKNQVEFIRFAEKEILPNFN